MLTLRASPRLCRQMPVSSGRGGVQNSRDLRTLDSALGLRSCAADILTECNRETVAGLFLGAFRGEGGGWKRTRGDAVVFFRPPRCDEAASCCICSPRSPSRIFGLAARRRCPARGRRRGAAWQCRRNRTGGELGPVRAVSSSQDGWYLLSHTIKGKCKVLAIHRAAGDNDKCLEMCYELSPNVPSSFPFSLFCESLRGRRTRYCIPG